MANDLGRNDPYRNMESGKSGIRPEFLKRNKESDAAKTADAAADLRDAENGASGAGMERPDSGLGGVAANEKNGGGGGFFTGAGKAAPNGSGNRFDFKGVLKKGGPIAAILALIVGMGGLMMGSSSLMPVAIEELIIEKFNSIGISSTTASDAWLDSQLNYSVRQEYVGTQEMGNLFGFSDYQKQSFKEQGIKVIEVGGTRVTRMTVLLYKNNNGVWIPVVGSDILQYNGFTEDELIAAIKEASGLNNVGSPVSAATAMLDKDFKTPYTTASKGWRGGSSGWFDQIMSSITEVKLGVKRNRWLRFTAKSLNDINTRFKETAEGTTISKTSDKGVEAKEEKVVGEIEVKNEETGEVTTKPDIEDVEITTVVDDETNEIVDVSDTSITRDSTPDKINRILNSKAMKAASAAASALDFSCGLVNAMVSIYAVASAFQSLQFLNLISGFLESVDKVKAGDDTESPINQYSENLVTVGDTVGDNDTVVARKTAMESQGMANLFSGSIINSNDTSVKNVNFETIMSNMSFLTGNIKTLTEASRACNVVQVGTAAVGLATTIISFIPIVGQGVKVTQVLVKELGRVAVQAAVMVAIGVIVPIATKNIAKLVIKNAATEWFGEDLGNAIASGANKYLGGNASSGNQSPAGEEQVLRYMGVRDAVIAEEAEYQREIRSPLDMSSKYTFLGSLAYSLMPLAYSNSGVMSVVKNTSSLASSAIIAMLPTASALDDTEILTSKGNCDVLETVGGVADAYCNAYIVTDVSTIHTEPAQAYKDVYYLNGGVYCYEQTNSGWVSCGYEKYNGYNNGTISMPAGIKFKSDGTMLKGTDAEASGTVYEYYSDALEENGNVKKKSDLAKYLTYCGQRTSQYGLQDETIAAQLTGSNTTVSKIAGALPGLSDIESLGDAIIKEANAKWISGQACVASVQNKDWETEYKYYQRYAEDMRLTESMDPGSKSAVTAFLEEYYEENPIDDSLEGTLARFSGMTVGQVEDTLALIEYYDFVANYDASERYAFTAPVYESDEAILFESDEVIASVYIVIPEKVQFADVRNRVNVV